MLPAPSSVAPHEHHERGSVWPTRARAGAVKRALIILGVLLLLLLIPIVVVGVMTFGPVATMDADTDLPGGARLVKDGYVSIGVVPAGEGAVALIDCGNDPNG